MSVSETTSVRRQHRLLKLYPDLDDWLWSLMKTLRATADTDKLYPPGEVYVVESHAVFVHEENESDSAGAKQIRKEGKRVILRYSEDVAVRFSEPVSWISHVDRDRDEADPTVVCRSFLGACSWTTALRRTKQVWMLSLRQSCRNLSTTM